MPFRSHLMNARTFPLTGDHFKIVETASDRGEGERSYSLNLQ